jgi:hypothetical protein
MRRLRAGIVAIGLTIVLGTAVSPARADTRTFTATLNSDARPTISGIPDNPDVRQVHIVYDTSGSLTITVDYWHAVNALDTSQNYSFWGSFSIGTGAGSESYKYCDTSAGGSLGGQHHVYSKYAFHFFDQASVVGYGGTLTLTRTMSPDNTEVTLTGSNPALANHDWTCATYTLYARTRSSIDNIYSHYDDYCDCWYVTTTLDSIGAAPGPVAYFDAPPPPPPPPLPPPPPPAPPPLPPPTPPSPRTHTLTVFHVGSGYGDVEKDGRAYGRPYCFDICDETFAAGTEVTLSATPQRNSTFAGWSGGGCSGAGTCKVRLDADVDVRARFTARQPVLSALAVSPRTFKSSGTRPSVRFTLEFGATVTFTIEQDLSGRLLGRRCVPVTPANRQQRTCIRLVARGGFQRAGGRGTNRFAYDGKVGGSKLGPGSYRLVATPSFNGLAGKAQSVNFQISR